MSESKKAEDALKKYIEETNYREKIGKPNHNTSFQIFDKDEDNKLELWVQAWRSKDGKNEEKIERPIFLGEFLNEQARMQEKSWMFEKILVTSQIKL